MDLFVNAVIFGLGLMVATIVIPFVVIGVAAILGLFVHLFEKIRGK